MSKKELELTEQEQETVRLLTKQIQEEQNRLPNPKHLTFTFENVPSDWLLDLDLDTETIPSPSKNPPKSPPQEQDSKNKKPQQKFFTTPLKITPQTNPSKNYQSSEIIQALETRPQTQDPIITKTTSKNKIPGQGHEFTCNKIANRLATRQNKTDPLFVIHNKSANHWTLLVFLPQQKPSHHHLLYIDPYGQEIESELLKQLIKTPQINLKCNSSLTTKIQPQNNITDCGPITLECAKIVKETITDKIKTVNLKDPQIQQKLKNLNFPKQNVFQLIRQTQRHLTNLPITQTNLYSLADITTILTTLMPKDLFLTGANIHQERPLKRKAETQAEPPPKTNAQQPEAKELLQELLNSLSPLP